MDRWTRDELELGGAAVSLKQRGYQWSEITAALDLGDDYETRRLAARFLLHLAKDSGRQRPEPQK